MDSSLKIWVLYFLLRFAISRGNDDACLADFDLYFTEKGIKDYVVHPGLSVSNAFTVCFRMRTTETSTDRVVFSYATSTAINANEILLVRVAGNKMRLVIDNDYRDISIGGATADGSWHHVCASWENVRGEYKLYRDGIIRAYALGLKSNHVISSTGTLVIGQDQDTVGGGFDASQCYVGELTDLNVWDQVLSDDEIKEKSLKCHGSIGNVKKWSDFRAGIRGDVKVLPSACEHA